jgi:hypothetical protein
MTSLDGNGLFLKFRGRAPVRAVEIGRFRAETGVDRVVQQSAEPAAGSSVQDPDE